MVINESDINKHNLQHIDHYQFELSLLKTKLGEEKYDSILKKIKEFQVTIPLWALTPDFTRREILFSGKGEPLNLEEKLQDVGLIHSLNCSSKTIFLHFPFDISGYYPKIKTLTQNLGLSIDTIGFNTSQGQISQQTCYEYGSPQNHTDGFGKETAQFIENIINCGNELGSKSITVWLDDKNFSRQLNFKRTFQNSLENLEEIYSRLPDDWKIFIGYKAFESHPYSISIDWEQSLLYAMKLGNKAFTLVNIEQQLANTNIDQVVSLLLAEGKLGGIHFNESQFGNNALTAGRINPYQLFLVFCEILKAAAGDQVGYTAEMRWVIYPGHNSADRLEDILQSIETITVAYAQALIVDKEQLMQIREASDFVKEEEILQNAFRTDVRPLLAQSRLTKGGALNPIEFFRANNIRNKLIQERRHKSFEIES